MIRSVQHREAVHCERLFGRIAARWNEFGLHPNAAPSSLFSLFAERIELCESNRRRADRHDSLAASEERL